MRDTRYSLLALSALAGTLLLSGCGGFVTSETAATATTSAMPAFSGSVYGGHAPLVGAHVFVLEAQATGTTYAPAAKSLLSASSTATAATYPVVQDTTSGSPTNGLYYVTTDANGQFNISGDYVCDTGSPVYLAAYGGAPSYTGAGPNVISLSSIVVSNVTGQTNSAGTATYTFNTKTPELFYIGEQVTFQNTTVTSNTTDTGAFNGPTFTVSATNLTSSSFQVTYTSDTGGYPTSSSPNFPAGTTTQPANATVTGLPTNNPAVANMGMLGVCGAANGSTNFSYLNFVYLNEVSTVAMANAMAAFATDPVHVGAPSTNLQGLQIAAKNAGLLYNIQGAVIGTTTPFAGEDHVANATTPGGNGTVDQAKIDNLGNILAACVDSQNTYNSATAPGGTESQQCTTLFAGATSNGTATGTKPADTGTAAINIANNPGTANVVALYTLPAGNVPFAPNLNTAPNDYTIGISFTANGINGPQGISVDGTGAIWIANFYPTSVIGTAGTNTVVKLNPDGTSITGATPYAPPAARTIAIDNSGNNNAWITPQYWSASATNPNLTYELNSAGAQTSTAQTQNTGTAGPFGAAIDGSGSLYLTNYYLNTSSIYKFTNAGAASNFGATGSSTNTTCGNGSSIEYLATDYSGNIWADGTYLSNVVCMINSAGTRQFNTTTSMNGPGAFAIDRNDNAWIPNQGSTTTPSGTNGTVAKVTSAGAVTVTAAGFAGLNTPAAVAVDGANVIWVANAGNETVTALSSTTVAISPSATNTYGYRYTSSNPTNRTQGNIAIDGSGDVWVGWNGPASGNETTVTEIIGAATPVVTPLSVAVKNNKLGQTP